MSVTAWPRLILSWPRLIEGWERTRSDDFLFEAGEAEEPWLESYRSPGFNANWHAAAEASDVYDALRPLINDQALRKGCDWLMSFFWNGVTPPKEEGLSAFAISLSPSGVKSFAALGDAIELERLRPAFEEVRDELPLRWFETFDAFAAYVRQWMVLLEAARVRQAGIVVTIA